MGWKGVLAQFFQRVLVGFPGSAKKYCGVAGVHVEGKVAYLIPRLVRMTDCRYMNIAILFKLLFGYEVRHEIDIGFANDYISPELQRFERDVKNDAVFNGINNV